METKNKMKSVKQKVIEFIKMNINEPSKRVVDDVYEIWGYDRKVIYAIIKKLKVESQNNNKDELEVVEEEYIPRYKGRVREKFVFDDSKLFI